MVEARATERHLPYGVAQCCLPPDTGERVPPKFQPDKSVLDLPTVDGWNSGVDLGGCLYTKMVYPSADSHPS